MISFRMKSMRLHITGYGLIRGGNKCKSINYEENT
jgi:hypothetical protein